MGISIEPKWVHDNNNHTNLFILILFFSYKQARLLGTGEPTYLYADSSEDPARTEECQRLSDEVLGHP